MEAPSTRQRRGLKLRLPDKPDKVNLMTPECETFVSKGHPINEVDETRGNKDDEIIGKAANAHKQRQAPHNTNPTYVVAGAHRDPLDFPHSSFSIMYFIDDSQEDDIGNLSEGTSAKLKEEAIRKFNKRKAQMQLPVKGYKYDVAGPSSKIDDVDGPSSKANNVDPRTLAHSPEAYLNDTGTSQTFQASPRRPLKASCIAFSIHWLHMKVSLQV